MKNIAIVVLILFLTACAHHKKTANSSKPENKSGISQADVDRGAAKFPGTTLESLVQGKTSYETHCQTCHALKVPGLVTETKWRSVMPEMVKNVNFKAGKTAIDANTQESILRYVITMGTAPKPVK